MTGLAAAQTGSVIVEREAGFLIVTLDQPRRRNAISLQMWRELTDIFRSAGGEDGVRALILTGSGGFFSSGADVKDLEDAGGDPDRIRIYEETVKACLAALEDAPVTTIAAVGGGCIGGGVALALACDFRVAGPDAYFLVPAARMGLVYAISSCERLAACVGVVNAKRVLFSTEPQSVEEARAMGLVQAVGPDALAAAKDFAGRLGHAAPLAIAGMKAILNAIRHGQVDARREQLQAAVARAEASADHQEAARAVAEKRPPVFRNA